MFEDSCKGNIVKSSLAINGCTTEHLINLTCHHVCVSPHLRIVIFTSSSVNRSPIVVNNSLNRSSCMKPDPSSSKQPKAFLITSSGSVPTNTYNELKPKLLTSTIQFLAKESQEHSEVEGPRSFWHHTIHGLVIRLLTYARTRIWQECSSSKQYAWLTAHC